MRPSSKSVSPALAVAGPCLLILAACFGPVEGATKPLALSADPASIAWVALAPASERRRFDHPAAEKIDALGDEAMAVLTDETLSADSRQRHFRTMLARELDIPLLARFMLGRYWRDATPEQRRAYEDAFAEYILVRYSSLLGASGKIEGFEVVDARTIENGDVLVESRIRRAGAEPIAASWRMRDRDGRFVVIDLLVEGLSMAQTQRQEFASILRANGGHIERLIAVLKEKAT